MGFASPGIPRRGTRHGDLDEGRPSRQTVEAPAAHGDLMFRAGSRCHRPSPQTGILRDPRLRRGKRRLTARGRPLRRVYLGFRDAVSHDTAAIEADPGPAAKSSSPRVGNGILATFGGPALDAPDPFCSMLRIVSATAADLPSVRQAHFRSRRKGGASSTPELCCHRLQRTMAIGYAMPLIIETHFSKSRLATLALAASARSCLLSAAGHDQEFAVGLRRTPLRRTRPVYRHCLIFI